MLSREHTDQPCTKRRRGAFSPRGGCGDSESAFRLIRTSNLDDLARTKYGTQVLIYFLFQTPRDGERLTTFAGADESALFHRLDRIAIG
jgi:hypothetical protein